MAGGPTCGAGRRGARAQRGTGSVHFFGGVGFFRPFDGERARALAKPAVLAGSIGHERFGCCACRCDGGVPGDVAGHGAGGDHVGLEVAAAC
jgi:hypothetical protein